MSLSKAFDPESYEKRIGEAWADARIFEARPESEASPFSLVIPPPNVTGALHIGHAFDLSLQDVVVRRARMLGQDAAWIPGTDHAGIATQMVVERRLNEEGESRHEMGRERFVEEIWKWKGEYRDRIVGSIKKLGASCDWSRERFTLDPGFSAAVRETFVRYYEEGLIYRGRRLINWCPCCRTALSDLEVDRDEPEKGELWSFAYRVEGEEREIVVATTRPETMLGDTAVAVHPSDERWAALVGKKLVHPIVPEREVPVVADEILADPETGTGAVKVTPAHDPNDFQCGMRHGLKQISIFDESGTVNDQGGPFAGLDRFEAREKVKERLEDLGLTRGTEEHFYAPGRCQRCRTVVEPMISSQWFCKMQPLAGPAIEAVRSGRIEFVPKSWEKTFFHWLENIEDWCISRQLWWGHRIPAWHCAACSEITVAREAPERCGGCGEGKLEQDPDVLDTWFSSQLWPFAVFGWPEENDEVRRYHPTSVLVTGFDIIFFWVARMIMSGLRLTGEVPFKRVLFHGLVRDAHGKKMSKTAGNAVEPSVLFDEHGVDAVRFTLAAMSTPGADVSLSSERLAGYRAFMNKLWNATRFALIRLPEGERFERRSYRLDDMDEVDRYLASSYLQLVDEVDAAFAEFRFDRVAERTYHFLWNTFCKWSIELSKEDLDEVEGGGFSERGAVRMSVLLDVLDGALRILHPIAPFVSEELWQQLPRRGGDAHFLAVSAAPTPDDPAVPIPEGLDREAAVRLVEEGLIGPVDAARSIRTGAGISPKTSLSIRLVCGEAQRELYDRFADRIAQLAGGEVSIVSALPEGEPFLKQSTGSVTVAVAAAGTIDVEKEREKLTKEINKIEKDLGKRRGKLSNERFLAGAPEEVVAKERALVAELEGRLGELSERAREWGGE